MVKTWGLGVWGEDRGMGWGIAQPEKNLITHLESMCKVEEKGKSC